MGGWLEVALQSLTRSAPAFSLLNRRLSRESRSCKLRRKADRVYEAFAQQSGPCMAQSHVEWQCQRRHIQAARLKPSRPSADSAHNRQQSTSSRPPTESHTMPAPCRRIQLLCTSSISMQILWSLGQFPFQHGVTHAANMRKRAAIP